VGSSWDRVVNDPKKDVFVFVYAPYCSACAALTSVWDKVAEHVKDHKDLMIAKFNIGSNETDAFRTKTLPSFRFYDKEGKETLFLDEKNRTFEGFVDFLKEHSSAYRNHFDQKPAGETVQHTEL